MKLLPQFVDQWLSVSISRKIRFYSLLVSTLIILILAVTSYTLLRQNIIESTKKNIIHEYRVVNNTLQLLFTSLSEHSNKLSLNALVNNSIIDSSGRDSYLVPLLQEHQDVMSIPLTVFLVDFQGVLIADNSLEKKLQYTLRPEVKQALQSGVSVSSVYKDSTGTLLLLAKPITFSPTQTIEGCIVTLIKLEDVFKQSITALELGNYAEFQIGNLTVTPHEQDVATLHMTPFNITTNFSSLFPAIELTLSLGQKKEHTFANLTTLTYIFTLVTPLLLLFVFMVTGKVFNKIAEPIIVLNNWAKNISKYGSSNINIPTNSSPDEIGQLTNSFNSMINKLSLSYSTLETKIKERTYQLQESEQRFRTLAYHDTLTGLPNKRLFEDRLQQAITSAQRHNNKFALLFIDMDRFKLINDSLGHDAGDELLKLVATRLKAALRESDTAARIGGDEFILLVENILELDGIVKVIDKIMITLTQGYEIKRQVVYSSPSIGISVYPDDSDTAQELIGQADIAMYQAKEKGRSTFVFYTQGMNDKVLRNIEIEKELRLALVRDELHVYLQPQINLSSGKMIGVEALLRWIHPTKGFISPAEFIPVAESSGLILPIGEWVLNQVVKTIHDRQARDLHCVPIAVNISPIQLNNDGFLEQITKMFDSYTFSRELLEFEITEEVFIKNQQKTVEIMESIAAMGIRFSLDDFGTGYSSLSYLRTFPISTLKIDQSFIRDITVDKQDAALTVAIISMAHSLGLMVIAEGIETIEQERFLLEYKCETGQGYLYAKPMPMDEFFAIIESQSPE